MKSLVVEITGDLRMLSLSPRAMIPPLLILALIRSVSTGLGSEAGAYASLTGTFTLMGYAIYRAWKRNYR